MYISLTTTSFTIEFEFLKVVGDVDTCLPHMMSELGIKLSAAEQKMNVRPLVSLICKRFFGDFNGWLLWL